MGAIARGSDRENDQKTLAGSGAFTSGLLFLTGFGLVGLGVALQFAAELASRFPSSYTSQLTGIKDSLADQNIPPFFLALSGFVAFGFGLVHRAARRPHIRVMPTTGGATQPDFRIVATEFAGGLNRVQGNLEKIAQRITVDSQAQRVFQETMRESAGSAGPQGMPSEDFQRLAAGFGSIREHIDQKVESLAEYHEENTRAIAGQIAAISGRFQEAQDALAALTETVGSMPAMIAAMAPSVETNSTPPAPMTQPAQPAQSTQPAHNTTPQPEPATGAFSDSDQQDDEPRIDTDRLVQEGLEVLGQLEGGAKPRAATTSRDPQTAEFYESLGMIEEEARQAERAPAPESTPSQASVPAQATQPTPVSNSGTTPEVQQQQTESTHSMPEPPPALPSPRPAAPRDLDSLLPDDVLRQALGDER